MHSIYDISHPFAGVRNLIIPSMNLASTEEALALSRMFPGYIYYAAGESISRPALSVHVLVHIYMHHCSTSKYSNVELHPCRGIVLNRHTKPFSNKHTSVKGVKLQLHTIWLINMIKTSKDHQETVKSEQYSSPFGCIYTKLALPCKQWSTWFLLPYTWYICVYIPLFCRYETGFWY